jgi:alpha-maltose-1-phosphate synthase
MRVALVSTAVASYCVGLANALASLCDVTLLMPAGQLAPFASVLDSRIGVESFGQPSAWSPRSILMAREILRRIERARPDVVHLQGGNPWLVPVLPFIGKRPLVTTIHDPWLHLGEKKIVDWMTSTLTARLSGHLIVHGERLRDYSIRRFRRPAETVTAIPMGEFSLYRRLSRHAASEPVPGRILFFGRIRAYKGIETLIRATPAIVRAVPTARVVIAGSGEWPEACWRQTHDSDMFEVVHRYIPDDEVARLFMEASLVVLPYSDASQSAVVCLAYSFGRPVVATCVGGIPELVEDGLTGLLVPPGEPGALAAAVISLLQSPPRLERMGTRALAKSRTDLSWDEIAGRTFDVYRRSLNP